MLFSRFRRLLVVLALSLAAMKANAQTRKWVLSVEVTPDTVLKHFPLQVGNRWIYETKYLTGDEEKPHLDHWIWELRITKHIQTPDGLIVLRARRELQVFSGRPYDQSGLRANPYLVTNGYVFELPETFSEQSTRAEGSAASEAREEYARGAREEFIQRWRKGEFAPEFFFPMRIGLMWAERQREQEEYQEWLKSRKEPDNFYHWQVVAKGGAGHCGCMKIPPGAVDLLYFTLGGPSETFFQDGVGVVGT